MRMMVASGIVCWQCEAVGVVYGEERREEDASEEGDAFTTRRTRTQAVAPCHQLRSVSGSATHPFADVGAAQLTR